MKSGERIIDGKDDNKGIWSARESEEDWKMKSGYRGRCTALRFISNSYETQVSKT